MCKERVTAYGIDWHFFPCFPARCFLRRRGWKRELWLPRKNLVSTFMCIFLISVKEGSHPLDKRPRVVEDIPLKGAVRAFVKSKDSVPYFAWGASTWREGRLSWKSQLYDPFITRLFAFGEKRFELNMRLKFS